MEAQGAPQIPRSPSWKKRSNSVDYTLDDGNEVLEALNHSVNATIFNIYSKSIGQCTGSNCSKHLPKL